MSIDDALLIADVGRITAKVESWVSDFESVEDRMIRELDLKFEMRDFKRTLRQLGELKERLMVRLS